MPKTAALAVNTSLLLMFLLSDSVTRWGSHPALPYVRLTLKFAGRADRG
jgi:hypothetical protein